MDSEPIRIGIVGAGNNTRERHIPGYQAIEGVEVISVCNRSRESSERVAREFNIPTVYDNWYELVEAADTNAICIGTWPYMHCPITLASLENNKHVLCEARMAMNAEEANRMFEASMERPHLVTQIVPSPFTLSVDDTINSMIGDGWLGDVLAIDMRAIEADDPEDVHSTGRFVDKDSPINWRQDRGLSGLNTLHMGIWYEALMRWVGPAESVMAMTSVNAPLRKDADGRMVAVTIPDHVDIVCRMAIGALARLRFSAVAGLSPGNEVWIHGSEGTLYLDAKTVTLYGGKRGDKDLKKVTIPSEKQGRWRVEEQFVNAIRGREKVTHTSFEDGVRYMEFTEAVIRSTQTGQAISLPL